MVVGSGLPVVGDDLVEDSFVDVVDKDVDLVDFVENKLDDKGCLLTVGQGEG